MYKFLILLFCFLCSKTKELYAYTEYNHEIDVTDGSDAFKLGIKIYVPNNNPGPGYNTYDSYPVYYYVHGGGWNNKSGQPDEIPPAEILFDGDYLCDRLGVIYVGLTYRVIQNNATFAQAIGDLEKSVEWFENLVNTNPNGIYTKADLSRVGFGGGSAGSTLSSVMALNYPNCTLYVGHEGMYDITTVVSGDNDNSNFPNPTSRSTYGLITNQQINEASAVQILNSRIPVTSNTVMPPRALLIHGEGDWLCDLRQSVRFANKIREFNISAQVIRHPKINHTSLARSYPETLKASSLEIADHFIRWFSIPNITPAYIQEIDTDIEIDLSLLFKNNNFSTSDFYGEWKDNRGTFKFSSNGTAIRTNNNLKTFNYTFVRDGDKVIATPTYTSDLGEVKTFFMRNNNRIYQFITEDNISPANERFVFRAYNYIKNTLSTNVNMLNNGLLYPNPTHKNLYLKNHLNDTIYSVYDLNGKTVIKNGKISNGTIHVDHLDSGFYILKLQHENLNLKFIKL